MDRQLRRAGRLTVGSSQLSVLSNSGFTNRMCRNQGSRTSAATSSPDCRCVARTGAAFSNRTGPEPRDAGQSAIGGQSCAEDLGLAGLQGTSRAPPRHLRAVGSAVGATAVVWNEQWRVGHFHRMVPAGYRDSFMSGINRLSDRTLAEYYERIRFVTRSKRLLTVERLRNIVGLNLGSTTI